jgi:hypothetical protein
MRVISTFAGNSDIARKWALLLYDNYSTPKEKPEGEILVFELAGSQETVYTDDPPAVWSEDLHTFLKENSGCTIQVGWMDEAYFNNLPDWSGKQE